EDEIKNHRVSRATARRVLTFARPYRRDILIFLVAVILDAVIGVATPVLAGRVINAITAGGSAAGTVVIKLAVLVGALAIADPALADPAAYLHPSGAPHRPAACRDHPRVVPARREDERHDDRAVRSRRRLAGQALRPARAGGRPVRRAGPTGA